MKPRGRGEGEKATDNGDSKQFPLRIKFNERKRERRVWRVSVLNDMTYDTRRSDPPASPSF